MQSAGLQQSRPPSAPTTLTHCFAALVALFVLVSAPLQANTLQDIYYRVLDGRQIQITLQLSEPPDAPASFTIANPARIALDLANTGNSMQNRLLPIGVGIARSVTTASAGERTRVVINLAKLVPHTTHIDGKQILIRFDSTASHSQPAGIATPSQLEEPASATRAESQGG